MPFQKVPNTHGSQGVEKSPSLEFKMASNSGRQPPNLPYTVNLPTILQHTSKDTEANSTAKKQLSNNNPLFYTPHSLGRPNPSLNKHDNGQLHVLPDIGAPDITDELIQNERRPSLGSVSGSMSRSTPLYDSKISYTYESPTQRGQGKAIFHTQSMKKKSMEPKFV